MLSFSFRYLEFIDLNLEDEVEIYSNVDSIWDLSGVFFHSLMFVFFLFCFVLFLFLFYFVSFCLIFFFFFRVLLIFFPACEKGFDSIFGLARKSAHALTYVRGQINTKLTHRKETS